MTGLRRFLGQSMAGRRSKPPARLYKIASSTIPGSFTYFADHAGFAQVFAWGAGGSGQAGGVNGGGSGAVIYRRVALSRGQAISGMIGAGGVGVSSPSNGVTGGDTTVRFPDGIDAVAGGGTFGGTPDSTGGLPRINADVIGFPGHPGGSPAGAGARSIANIIPGVDPPLLPAPQASAGSNGNLSGATTNAGPGRVLIFFLKV